MNKKVILINVKCFNRRLTYGLGFDSQKTKCHPYTETHALITLGQFGYLVDLGNHRHKNEIGSSKSKHLMPSLMPSLARKATYYLLGYSNPAAGT